jgi:hypothetical protein
VNLESFFVELAKVRVVDSDDPAWSRVDAAQRIMLSVMNALSRPSDKGDEWLRDTERRALDRHANTIPEERALLVRALRDGLVIPVGDLDPSAVEAEVKRVRKAKGRGVYAAAARLWLKAGLATQKPGENESKAVERIADLFRHADDDDPESSGSG